MDDALMDPLGNQNDPLADPDVWMAYADPSGQFTPGDPPQFTGRRNAGSGRRKAASCGCDQRKKLAMTAGAVVVGGLGVGLAIRFLRRR